MPEKQGFSLGLRKCTSVTYPGQHRTLTNMNMQPTIINHLKKMKAVKERELIPGMKELLPEETKLIEETKGSQEHVTFKRRADGFKKDLSDSLEIKNMITKINNRWLK